MQDFNFHRPTTIAEALELLRATDEGKFLAGGQSLLPVMKLGMAQPSDIVSLTGVEALRGIAVAGGKVSIGALMTHFEVSKSAQVQSAIPALADMAAHIGDPQVRNRGTLGGSVAHADPASDYPAALVALGATIETDRRTLAADGFFAGYFETELEEDELITRVHFPIPANAAYVKFANPASKYAIVGVMVAKHHDGSVRVVVTGAGPGVFRVEAMEQALAAEFSASALEGICVDSDDLNDDLDASAEYRAHLVGVIAKRAVSACL